MSAEPLPDHWKALGLEKGADAATIKKTYRKLVLTCHPDKVTDPALKAQKQDEFHKIQQAYETLSDDTRKATYEAELKLQQLRREKLARTASGSTVETKSARFAQPTTGGGSYTANTSSRYNTERYNTEERRPSGTTSSRHHDYDEERYHGSSKTDSYFATPRRSSPRPSPSSRSSREKYEKDVRREKPSDRTRSSTTKARDNERRDRTGRFPVESDGSSSEERARYERSQKTRVDDDSQRREERRRDDRRYDDYENSTPRKLSVQQDDAIRYISKSRAEAEINLRPSPVRTSSRDYYEPSSRSSRHREVRPEPAPRRSSARPKERPSMPSRRDTDRGIPEVVEWDERRPSFKQSASSPAEIRIPSTPQRSATDSYRRSERSPPRFPGLSRSATMPVNPGSEAGGSRREPKSYPRPSGLRNEANSSPERDSYPTVPAPQSSNKTYYTYSVADGGVKAMDPPAHRTVLREPERMRHRSPSPIGKPPMGANRPSLHSAKTYAPGRSSRQSSPVREERGRSGQMKYGEMPSDFTRRRGMGERQSSYSPHDVSYAPSYGPEDIRWAPKRGDDRYAERKPTLSRTATYAY